MSLGPLMVDIAGTRLLPEDREVLAHPLVGSVILFTRNFHDPQQLRELVAEIHAVRTPPLLVAVDHEGGRVQRFRSGFTALPPLRAIGHAYDQDRARGLALARQHGWLMAAELMAVGIDFSFAPCVDLHYGLSEVIGDRALHARGQAVAELAVAYVHGMNDAGMAATAKHFPGHGAVVADSHLALPVDRREYADLAEDLRPYQLLISNGLAAIMVAHVLVPAVDALPASFSRRWVGDILRGEFRFRGAVFADDLSMRGAAAIGDIVTRATRAQSAGCDVLPVCNDRAAVRTLLERWQAGPDPTAHLRLARMRGRPALEVRSLQESVRWRDSRDALAACVAPPPLSLGGDS